ncbi:ribose-phosphate pyrophosphokinase [Candidatus Shapirobacteria bacterium]|nr:ribose-phosphate pyrophosphokinase [Candidatus Shapirobacteria bacterium]
MSENFVILTGTANKPLAKEIGKILKTEVYDPITVFSDGEIRVKIPHNMRRRHVYIIQPTSYPVNDHIMELMLMIDAAKRGSASEVIAVIPYFGYSRQDRKEVSRVPISASLVASTIEHAGASRILTVDIHSEQQEGFVSIPWDNVYGSYSLVPVLKKRNLSNLIVASPDKGGMKRATGYARLLGAKGLALVYKERDIDMSNVSEALGMMGEVKDKDVLLVDDMIDTGGTLINAAEYLKKNGAKSISAAVTHGLFSGSSLENITKSVIEEVIVSDTIMLREEVVKNKKVIIVPVAPLLAEAIRHTETGESISHDLIL